MNLTEHLPTLWLTAKLASVTTVCLLLICLPFAWWLARSSRRLKPALLALTTLPLILPPTVLGFYLLVGMGPNGPIGQLTSALGIGLLPFTFSGLVIASMVYSLPFVLQPLVNAFEAIDEKLLEAAAMLKCSTSRCFFTVVLPMQKAAIATACVLGFAHTIGEFGVVLMLGGNIAGQTRVVSIDIYNHVEAMNYPAAHELSLLLIGVSLALLWLLFWLRGRTPR